MRLNLIQRLQNTEGAWFEWNDGLSDLIVSYFEHMFAASESQWEEVVNKVPVSITELLREVSIEEVRFALFQMHPDKSLVRMV